MMFSKLKLKKRNCNIKMRIVPYGGGWTDVHLDIGGDSHYFIISNVMSTGFGDFLSVLYRLYPENETNISQFDRIEIKCKTGICKFIDNKYKVVKIVDRSADYPGPCVTIDIPWKAEFSWDEEGAYSKWTLERIPDENTDFMLNIRIEHHSKKFEYSVPYKDFCYAVAKACTEMLKEYGFGGYHNSTYTEEINLRHMLFIKSVALDNFDALKLTYYKEKGHGETTDFKKELELLLFDM